MAKKKTSFYHTRWNKVKVNYEVDEVKDFDERGAPPMAEKLLLLWDHKRVNVEGWDGFIFSRGVLKFKNYRWGPDTIIRFRDQSNELDRLKAEVAYLKSWRGIRRSLVVKLVEFVKVRHKRLTVMLASL